MDSCSSSKWVVVSFLERHHLVSPPNETKLTFRRQHYAKADVVGKGAVMWLLLLGMHAAQAAAAYASSDQHKHHTVVITANELRAAAVAEPITDELRILCFNGNNTACIPIVRALDQEPG